MPKSKKPAGGSRAQSFDPRYAPKSGYRPGGQRDFDRDGGREDRRDAPARARFRAEQRDAVVETVGRCNPEAVICVGVPFGHTRPQWILPHGGTMTLDGASHRITASYA